MLIEGVMPKNNFRGFVHIWSQEWNCTERGEWIAKNNKKIPKNTKNSVTMLFLIKLLRFKF